MLGAWVPVLDTDQHRAQRGPDLAREPHILPGVESGPWYSWSRRLVIATWGNGRRIGTLALTAGSIPPVCRVRVQGS